MDVSEALADVCRLRFTSSSGGDGARRLPVRYIHLHASPPARRGSAAARGGAGRSSGSCRLRGLLNLDTIKHTGELFRLFLTLLVKGALEQSQLARGLLVVRLKHKDALEICLGFVERAELCVALATPEQGCTPREGGERVWGE